MNDCPLCGYPMTTNVDTGVLWCCVYGWHDGALSPPPPPGTPLVYDDADKRWRVK